MRAAISLYLLCADDEADDTIGGSRVQMPAAAATAPLSTGRWMCAAAMPAFTTRTILWRLHCDTIGDIKIVYSIS